ncbi:MAG: 3-isopropylmalate dehydratase small subunit [Candidatus Omnitrophica bacterium CG1_02_44_16]|nr:MAG: 3-isopropylmalate dehydratase small subunit [Candidatus Omnitrophica bacterium CG1_02_44_16]PIY82083.1 MAG: 3-isopropylmalate dehydratase small subunit [Candidatus Omnitrophica bacterium CG_4_10_14_0_8_um_filter_44_12]PIZ83270.1 MAG: 3-isopropylmalate dehydratase small subunit [Candidatus Omnitrophica bacterium CG_4_10_14_0_2_um_filter_44_9]
MVIKGRAHKFGNDVNTDDIISARYLNTTDPKELGACCMEILDRDFSKKVKPGDIIVAGNNFGCGSSREHAPISIKGCGVSLVIAKSFARIFYRNSINIGLPIIESVNTDGISSQDELEVDLTHGEIKNLTTGKVYHATPFAGFVSSIIEKGGLMNWIKTTERKNI